MSRLARIRVYMRETGIKATAADKDTLLHVWVALIEKAFQHEHSRAASRKPVRDHPFVTDLHTSISSLCGRFLTVPFQSITIAASAQ